MNLKKGCPSLAPCPDGLPPWDTGQAKRANSSVTERNDSSADSRKVEVLLNKTASAPASLDLCGRLSVGGFDVDACALTLSRGPIRRRPYNRGEIVSKKRREMVVFNDFY